MTDDPTRIRNQPALTTSTGRSWLIIGALFVAISLVVLVPMMALEPHGVAFGAVIANVALYLVMAVTRFSVPGGRLRLGLMAGALLTIAAVSLIAVTIVAVAA